MAFTQAQIEAIRKVAKKHGVEEVASEDQKGIFLDTATRVIINCKVMSKEKEFKGLPEIGITDMKGFTDENAGGQTIDNIRSDIRDALKALPKWKPKTAYQSPGWKEPGGKATDEVNKDETISAKHILPEQKNDTGTDKTNQISETDKAHKSETAKIEEPQKVDGVMPPVPKPPVPSSEPKSIKDTIEKDKKANESKVPKTQDISPTATKSPESEQKKPINIVVCSACKTEISHKRALECLDMGERPICEGCFDENEANNQTEPEIKDGKIMSEQFYYNKDSDNLPPKQTPKEPEILPPKAKPKTDKEISDAIEAAQNAKKPKNALIVGTCADLAKQYGIPAELANMYFMTLNDGLYIKNPGLLYLASKKGYGRIEVETEYNEKTQEYESTCKIYPKITKDIIEGISKLSPEMQKTAWDYATAPTNGTGRASKASVKMSTMHPFLKEMSQTRAQNRALRAYTGYGGTSLEELPDAEVKCIEG